MWIWYKCKNRRWKFFYITRFGRDDLIDYLLDLGVDTEYRNDDDNSWYEELDYFIPRYPKLKKYMDEEPAGYDSDEWYEHQLYM